MGEGWGRMLFVLVFVLLFLFAVVLFAGCGPVSVLVVLLVLLALLVMLLFGVVVFLSLQLFWLMIALPCEHTTAEKKCVCQVHLAQIQHILLPPLARLPHLRRS